MDAITAIKDILYLGNKCYAIDDGCSGCRLSAECNRTSRQNIWESRFEFIPTKPNYEVEDGVLDNNSTYEYIQRIYLGKEEGGYSPQELYQMFGTSQFSRILKENTPQTIEDKINAWESTHNPFEDIEEEPPKRADWNIIWDETPILSKRSIDILKELAGVK